MRLHCFVYSLTVVVLDALDIVVLLYVYLVGKNATFLGVLVLLVTCNNLIISRVHNIRGRGEYQTSIVWPNALRK